MTERITDPGEDACMIKRLGAAGLLLILLLSAATCGLAETTILMTFTGDCTLGSEENNRKKPDSFDSCMEKNGYDYCFANFREMFEQDDLTVVNLEGVLSDSSYQENKKKPFRFRGPTDFVKILTGSSVEAACIANNHIMDFGAQGEKSTREALEAAGVGWFRNENHYLYKHEGITIAFFALENSKYYSLRKKLPKIFRELKETGGVNAIVVCVHTGLEYRGKHDKAAAEMTNNLVNWGADLVVMHHPHVLQGMEIINNRNVFYSLGNFVFGGNNSIKTKVYSSMTVTSLYTMVLQVKMTFSETGTYLGQQAVIYPAHISSDPQVNYYQPLRLNAEDAVPVREAIQRDTAFELPAIEEKDGLSLMEFEYLPAPEAAQKTETQEEQTGNMIPVPEEP